jgi:hypothetical protein
MQGSFFLGESLSMVDLAFVPFLERMVSSLLYYKGFAIRGTGMFPGVDAWFQALERRPSYLAARSDHYTHCHDLPPQLGGMHEGLVARATLLEVLVWNAECLLETSGRYCAKGLNLLLWQEGTEPNAVQDVSNTGTGKCLRSR